MKRYIETALRLRWRMIISALLIFGLGSGALYFAKQGSYTSSATVWVENPLYFPKETATNPYLSAATNQANVFNEFLRTRQFSLSIAQKALIPIPTLAAEQQAIKTIQDGLQVEAVGAHLVRMTCVDNKTNYCKSIIESAIQVFIAELNANRARQASVALQLYKEQRATYEQQMLNSKADLDKYISENPDALRATLNPNPTYVELQQQYSTNRARYDDIALKIEEIQAQSEAAPELNNTFFRVMDAPTDATPYVTTVKDLLRNELIALVLALIGCASILLIAAWSDQAIYTLSDVTALVLPDDGSSRELLVALVPQVKSMALDRKTAAKRGDAESTNPAPRPKGGSSMRPGSVEMENTLKRAGAELMDLAPVQAQQLGVSLDR